MGVRWPSGLKTTDIDSSAFAKRIELGIPQTPQTMASIPRVIEALEIRVPEPARFAVHKLLVASNRGPQAALKADKDRLQSALLMSHLEREWPGNLTLAAEDAMSRGSSWAK